MEALPLLEGIDGLLLVRFAAPVQHLRGVVQANLLAVRFDDAVRVVEEVVRVDDGDAHLILLYGLAAHGGTDDVLRAEKVEDATELVIAGFIGQEVVEAGDGVQGWDATTIVGWNAAARVADQKGEVEFLEHLNGHDCGVSWFGFRPKRVGARRGSMVTVGQAIDLTVCHPVGVSAGICSDALSDLSAEGWRNLSRLLLRWHEIVRDVFDEQSFSLQQISLCFK